MRKKHEKEIDGILYITHEFPATEGLEIAIDLWKLIGPAGINVLFALIAEGQGEDGTTYLTKAIELFTQNMNKEKIELMKRMLTYTYTEKGKIVFDEHFAGRLAHLIKVLIFVAEVNFKDFFSDFLKGAIEKARQLTEAELNISSSEET